MSKGPHVTESVVKRVMNNHFYMTDGTCSCTSDLVDLKTEFDDKHLADELDMAMYEEFQQEERRKKSEEADSSNL